MLMISPLSTTTNDIPDPTCKPEIVDRRVTFNLSLSDFYNCMITKVVNKHTVGCSQEMTESYLQSADRVGLCSTNMLCWSIATVPSKPSW